MSAFAVINITAAENFYGELAKELGGTYVNVTTILNNPNQDPHLFSANPHTLKAIWDANIIIYNGAHYDAWMKLLLNAARERPQKIIAVADLLHIQPNENPHLWYHPDAMPRLANALVQALIEQDQPHKKFYMQQLRHFQNDYDVYLKEIAQLKNKLQNTHIIATEPIFGYLAKALGLIMEGEDFQWRIMNDASPSPLQIKAFEKILKERKVKVLLFNRQVNSPLTQHLLQVAKEAGIPAVGVTETQPTGIRYTQWMRQQLKAIDTAFSHDS